MNGLAANTLTKFNGTTRFDISTMLNYVHTNISVCSQKTTPRGSNVVCGTLTF